MRSLRSAITALVTFLGGLYFFLEFLLPADISGFQFGLYHEQILKGVQIVGAMAIGLGLINLLRVHGSTVLLNRSGAKSSAALLLGMLAVFGIKIVDAVQTEHASQIQQQFDTLSQFAAVIKQDAAEKRRPPLPRSAALETALGGLIAEVSSEYAAKLESQNPAAAELNAALQTAAQKAQELTAAYQSAESASPRIDQGTDNLTAALQHSAALFQAAAAEVSAQSFASRAFQLIYEAFFVPLGSAMFALLAFYVATAAYRSFRIRSFEASIMMLAAIVVMLGQIPHGPLYISPALPAVRRWLLMNVSTPTFRAIYFGAAVAGLAMAVRMWLSLEKGPLQSDDDEEAKS